MSLYDFKVRTIDGADTSLAPYRGKVLLIVNVASQCGFTGQYQGLEKLFEKYGERGFVVLGFPCNQFGGQEPGPDAEIQRFCKDRFGVSFPLFAKIEVNGAGTHPLYAFLKQQRPGILGTQRIKWNFTKFLIDAQGNVTARFAPQIKPEALEGEIEGLL